MKKFNITNPKTGVKIQLEITFDEVFLTFIELKQVEKCSLTEKDVDFLLWANIEKQHRATIKSLIIETMQKYDLKWMTK